jgi:hypothetical protein
MQSKVLGIEYCDIGTATVLGQQSEDYNAIVYFNLIYIQMAIIEQS